MTDAIHEFIEDDGSVSLIDAAQAQLDVRDLVAAMIVLKNPKPASTELMRLRHESGSTAYTRWLAEESIKLLGMYLLHAANPIEISIALRELHPFILSYRVIRPAAEEPITPNSLPTSGDPTSEREETK
ncbi:hypothetical protein BH09ACT6_BH09ACT6_05870 [soil metagenome]